MNEYNRLSHPRPRRIDEEDSNERQHQANVRGHVPLSPEHDLRPPVGDRPRHGPAPAGGCRGRELQEVDDRRLAYEIKGNKRGVYFPTFFRCEPSRVADLERACNLSEQLLRSLVIRADHLNTEDIEAAEGREALADEIKLRTEQDSTTSDSGDGASTVTIGGGSEAPEAPAETATATEEAPAAEETPQEN